MKTQYTRRKKLLKDIAKLVDAYEVMNMNKPIGCYLDFLPNGDYFYEWDGAGFSKTNGRLFKK